MTKKELKEIAKKRKEQQIPIEKELITKHIQKLMRMIYRTERLLGKNNYSESKIYRLSLQKQLSPESLQELEDSYDVDKMLNHSTITDFGYDLENEVADMRKLDYELMKMVLFDKDKKKIKTLKGTTKSPLSVGGKIVKQLEQRTINTKNCKYAIRIHNHPHCISAMPSLQDNMGFERGRKLFEEAGIELLDDCVVTEFDFFSRNQ